jgi:selenoprotein W-related protein
MSESTTPAPIKVTIAYCAECGYEPQTLSLTDALMKTFGLQLSAIEILPWHDGSFDVSINGKMVHSMYQDGGFPENEKIVNAVKAELARSGQGDAPAGRRLPG